MSDGTRYDPRYNPASQDWFLDSPEGSEADWRYRYYTAQRRLYEYNMNSAVAGVMTWGVGWVAGRRMSKRLREYIAELEREAGQHPEWKVCQERDRYRADRWPVRQLRAPSPPPQRGSTGATRPPAVEQSTTEESTTRPRCMHCGYLTSAARCPMCSQPTGSS